MKQFLPLLAASLIVMCGSIAFAQVRHAPDGNSLPDQALPPSLQMGQAQLGAAQDQAPQVMSRAEHESFASRVDVTAFSRLAVFDDGRAKIMETLAEEQLTRIFGNPHFFGHPSWYDMSAPAQEQFKYDPVFTYLDLIFDQPYYYDKPIIYVEVVPVRRALLSNLPPDQQEIWMRRGRITPEMLADPKVGQAVAGMSADLLMQRGLSQVELAVRAFQTPDNLLYIVSPAPGSDRWAHLFELTDTRTASAANELPAAPLPVVSDPQTARAVIEQFKQLRDAWRSADAVKVNLALSSLAAELPQLNPQSYPSAFHREAEHVYNATNKFTIGYLGYLAATIILLIAFGTRHRWLIRTGIGLMFLGFTVHTLGILVRMILSHRWPIQNQYESYIAISWLAMLVGIILMFSTRRWLYGAAASAMGAAALLFANTVDIPSREVGPVAGILATSRILYVHVHMVLASYGLISLGFFVSLFYLAVYYWRSPSVTLFAATGLGQVEMEVSGDLASGGGGGGGGLTSGGGGSGGRPALGRQALLHDLDRAQMVVLQLAFWILPTGILLGAFWADHAWGRWWGWDPKETWALITWIIYLMVIHLRLAVKNRGLVTAWMSVLGFCVMLWTYWGVNLLLAGLHSYA